jgi:hypothetical protein
MQWEYTMVSGRIMAPEGSREFHGQGMDLLWKTQTENPTTWQHIQAAGQEGWEMINAFPIAEYTEEDNAGYTSIIAFIFKRPLRMSRETSTPSGSSNQEVGEA